MLLGDIAIMPRKEDGPRLAEEAWSLAFSIARLRWCGLLTIAPYREDDCVQPVGSRKKLWFIPHFPSLNTFKIHPGVPAAQLC